MLCLQGPENLRAAGQLQSYEKTSSAASSTVMEAS